MIVTLHTRANATWNKIANLNYPIGCCFFFDDNNGFVGSGNATQLLTLRIWYTADGGKTWTASAVPDGSGYVTQISIGKDGVGYASVFVNGGTPFMNLWKTTDKGLTWFDVSSGFRLGTGVGVSPKLFATTSWTKPTDNTSTNGVFFMDDTTMLITPGPKKPGPLAEAWSAFGDPATRLWYAVTELSRQVYVSADGGLSWTKLATFNIAGSMTGHIYGKAGWLYVQSEQGGMYRSNTATGATTWTQIADASMNNPTNLADTRTFYVGGCSGEMVIAFDKFGNVWKTTDGGDGTLKIKAGIGFVHPVFTSFTACNNQKRQIVITNYNCYDFQINAITFVNNTNGAYSLATPALPDTIRSGASQAFELSLDPAKKPGNFTCRVHVNGVFLGGGQPLPVDSMIDVQVVVTGEQPQLEIKPLSIQFDTASICGGQSDSSFTIRNPSCDTITITSGPGALGPEYTIDPLALPYKLPHDSTITLRCHYRPTTAGATPQSYPVYAGTMQGKTTSVQMTLEGFASDGSAQLKSWPPAIDFDTISLCAPGDSALISLTNTGCVSLLLDSLVLAGDADYTLTGGTTTTLAIKPNDTVRAWVRFGPKLKNRRTAIVRIHTHSGSVDSTVMTAVVNITAFVRDGGKQLVTSLGSIDFGEMSPCESRDSSVTIRNIGCDTLRVDSLQLVGTGFALGATGGFPVLLPPNKTLTIPIHAAPVGTLTSFTGTVRVFSNSDSAVKPIQVSFTLHGTSPNVRLWLTIDSPSGTEGLNNTIRLKADPATITQYSSVDVTMNWNLDLLTHLGSRGPNTVSPASAMTTNGPWSFRISRTPALAVDPDSSIALFDNLVYLTRDTATAVDLSVVRVNDTIPGSGPCTMQATADGTSFTYITTGCNQDVIAGFMRTGVVRVTSISPNPTNGDVSLTITSPTKHEATIKVFDLVGKEVLRRIVKLSSGENAVPLATSGLARSRYSVRITTDSGEVTTAFVKE